MSKIQRGAIILMLLGIYLTALAAPFVAEHSADQQFEKQVGLLAARQVQERAALEARMQRLQASVDALRPSASDLCIDAPVYVPWAEGYFAEIAHTVICGTNGGLVMSETAWAPAVPYEKELQRAYVVRDYWKACALGAGPCNE